jgi:(S)-2-hydroxyglutarate dehydrogenase
VPPERCDLLVVGAGILGLAVARELCLRSPAARVVVVDGADRVGAHQTGHNSGVLHRGIYYAPGSLKARLCVQGARLLEEYCNRHGIAVERCGKVVVAVTAGERASLDELERRGRANAVPGLRRLTGDQLRQLEPAVRGLDALHSPQTAIVDFCAVAERLAADIREAGGSVGLGCAVTGVRPGRGRLHVVHPDGEIRTRAAVFCAGAWADRLAIAAGGAVDPRIVPFRGGYLRLRPERRELVQSLIYPVPDPALPFLGVHLTRHVSGDVLLGPTALLAPARDAYRLEAIRPRDVAETLAWPGSWRMARRWWRTGLGELRMAISRRAFVEAAARYLPELSIDDVLPGPAGVRAQAVGRDGRLVDDFVFSHTERALHVRNAPSPGATSSLAIAGHIADLAARRFDLPGLA